PALFGARRHSTRGITETTYGARHEALLRLAAVGSSRATRLRRDQLALAESRGSEQRRLGVARQTGGRRGPAVWPSIGQGRSRGDGHLPEQHGRGSGPVAATRGAVSRTPNHECAAPQPIAGRAVDGPGAGPRLSPAR